MKKILKIISTIISLVILGFAAYHIYNTIQTFKENEPNIETLDTPVISYDEETSILSWKEIEGATSYVVSINGIEYTTEELKYNVFINAITTEMKVKAKSNLGYTIQNGQTLTHILFQKKILKRLLELLLVIF